MVLPSEAFELVKTDQERDLEAFGYLDFDSMCRGSEKGSYHSSFVETYDNKFGFIFKKDIMVLEKVQEENTRKMIKGSENHLYKESFRSLELLNLERR